MYQNVQKGTFHVTEGRLLRAYFKNRRFVRNPALSRTPESRQNPKEMPHFCLLDSPNAARTAPKVDKNPEKSEK